MCSLFTLYLSLCSSLDTIVFRFLCLNKYFVSCSSNNICINAKYLPIWEGEGRSSPSSPCSCTPLLLVAWICWDKPSTAGYTHLERQGLQAAMYAGQFRVEHGRPTQAQAFTGVTGRINVEDGRWAWNETRSSVGTSQILKLRIWGYFGRKILDSHTGVKTVRVDLVQVSQAGRAAETFSAEHPRNQAENKTSQIEGKHSNSIFSTP